MEQTIVDLISNVGFPILMCLLMYKAMDDTRSTHSEEVEKLSDAINNNTLVIQSLVDRFDMGGENNGNS